RKIFRHIDHFALDFKVFSSIIYILYEGGRLRPSIVRPRFRAFQLSVLTSRRKNGEEGWKEKGRQEAVSSRPTGTGGASRCTPFFLTAHRREPVPSPAALTCQAAEASRRRAERA